MPKYYLTQNVNRPVGPVEKPFRFEATEYFVATNSWWGTFEAESAEDIATLEALVGTGGIFEISEEEFLREDVKKKRPYVSPSLVELKSWHAPQPGPPKPDVGPAVVAEVETVESALTPKTVAVAKPTKGSSKK